MSSSLCCSSWAEGGADTAGSTRSHSATVPRFTARLTIWSQAPKVEGQRLIILPATASPRPSPVPPCARQPPGLVVPQTRHPERGRGISTPRSSLPRDTTKHPPPRRFLRSRGARDHQEPGG